MHRPVTEPYRPFGRAVRCLVTAVAVGVAPGMGFGCGSSGSEPTGPAQPGPNGGTAGSANQMPANGTPQPNNEAPAPVTRANEGGAGPVSVEAPPVEDTVADSCAAPADTCTACLCSECAGELGVCATTPGCLEILACVRDSGCSGQDCYCGTAILPACFGGAGNGPCKAVLLAAPGGREPTFDNPSGGPASDAALSIADCAEEGDQCTSECLADEPP